METDMGCLFPPAQVFNDLCPMLLLDVTVSQPCVLGKQHSVTMVQMLPLKERAA